MTGRRNKDLPWEALDKAMHQIRVRNQEYQSHQVQKADQDSVHESGVAKIKAVKDAPRERRGNVGSHRRKADRDSARLVLPVVAASRLLTMVPVSGAVLLSLV